MSDLRHHSLVAWQRADDLFIAVHKLATKSFPPSERFELTAQVRKAAYSIPANIAEGFGRRHRNDRLRFLNFAEGSIAEVDYCLHAACRLGYISQEQLERFRADLRAVNAPLMGLIRHIRLTKTVEVGLILLAVFPLGRFFF